MNNCWFLIVAVATISSSFRVAGQQIPRRLGGVAQQGEFQSWMKLKIDEMELEDEELQDDDRKLNLIQQLLHNLVEKLISSSYPTAVANNISQQCQNDSIEYVHNLYQRSWAMRSKFHYGIIKI